MSAIRLHVINSPKHPVVLGFPQLVKPNPPIDLSTGVDLSAETVPHLSREVYVHQNLSREFRSQGGLHSGTSLPLNRPYTFTVDLLLPRGSCSPWDRIDSLSALENWDWSHAGVPWPGPPHSALHFSSGCRFIICGKWWRPLPVHRYLWYQKDNGKISRSHWHNFS